MVLWVQGPWKIAYFGRSFSRAGRLVGSTSNGGNPVRSGVWHGVPSRKFLEGGTAARIGPSLRRRHAPNQSL